ncbi:MAG: hypothetical protein NTW35_03390, partial [Candidatus Nomurabacteria bacterium]|nr:hypothetical protein [Candidatus Nomurabacteria bacterium]
IHMITIILLFGMFLFFTAIQSAKEILFNRKNVEVPEKKFLVTKLVFLFSSMYVFILFLIFGLIFYAGVVDAKGSGESGMMFLALFAFIPAFIIIFILGIIFSKFYYSTLNYDTFLKRFDQDIDLNLGYRRYLSTIVFISLFIISVFIGPVIISNYIIDQKEKAYSIQLEEQTKKDNENKKWWSNHIVTKNVKPLEQLSIEELILQKNEIPPSCSLADDRLVSNDSLLILDINPKNVSKIYFARYSDDIIYNDVKINVVKYINVEDLMKDFLNLEARREYSKQKMSITDKRNPETRSIIEKNFIIVSNYLIIIANDLNYFINPKESITELIREKFPEAQFSLSEKNTDNSSTVASTTNLVPVLVPTSQKVSPPHTDFKIVFPNGGESIKIGDVSGIGWNSGSFPKDAQLDVEIFEITGDKIIFDKNGACINCIGGGLRSGISALSPVIGGVKSAEWKNPGITYSGERLKPGSHYVIKAVVSKTGTYEKGECPKSYPVCTVDIATDWSDGVFSLVN